jgi:hypothetical protein
VNLYSNDFLNGAQIPAALAFCAQDPAARVTLSSNRNPHLAWDGVPADTRSLALICHDPDVPSRGDDVNKEGRVIPADLPRVEFFHWVLVDLPPTLRTVAQGEFASAVAARGKPGPAAPHGSRHGINDYTGWFSGDADMAGDYYGYDGPCPPWNDTIAHRYVFTLYALDISRVGLEGRFGGADVRAAISGHVLASAALMGRYSLNPSISL